MERQREEFPSRRKSPQMEIAVAAGEIDARLEEAGESGGLKDFALGAVGQDFSGAHEDDALDFGNDVGDVMGDQDDANAGLGERSHGLAETVLRGDIEGVGGLVEDEGARLVDESAGDEDALGFAGREFVHGAGGEVGGAEALERLSGERALLGCDVVMVEDLGARKEAGKDNVHAGGFGGEEGHEVVGDDAEKVAKLEDVPAVAAEDGDGGILARDGVEFAGERFYESGFAAAVGAEDGDVLLRIDAK